MCFFATGLCTVACPGQAARCLSSGFRTKFRCSQIALRLGGLQVEQLLLSVVLHVMVKAIQGIMILHV